MEITLTMPLLFALLLCIVHWSTFTTQSSRAVHPGTCRHCKNGCASRTNSENSAFFVNIAQDEKCKSDGVPLQLKKTSYFEWKRTDITLMLLITPKLCLLWQVKMSNTKEIIKRLQERSSQNASFLKRGITGEKHWHLVAVQRYICLTGSIS